jgi:ankyrin repeat protein
MFTTTTTQINVNTRTNESPLIVTCDRNKEVVVKLLLSYEACDVNIIDCDNCNALHYACKNGQADIVELLLKRHCNINQCSKLMKTPHSYYQVEA